MNTSDPTPFTLNSGNRRLLGRGFVLLPSAFIFAAALSAQTTPDAAPAAAPAAPAPATAGTPVPDPGAANGERGRRGNFNPADIQARLLAGLRTQLVVTDDTEWALISERVMKVFELRRSTGGGFGGFAAFAGRNRQGGGAAATADPEVDALRAAITDNLPDAEIKSRLARVRDVRKQNEAKLDQAREDLRAVLTVRQEAVAVMYGLLN